MTLPTHSEARTLIVVSREHGELALATNFLRGQNLANQALMLVPDTLLPLHQNSLPAPALPYASAEDVLKAVGQHQADLVCLFSAYLLSFGRIMSTGTLAGLVDQLHDRGCRVLTSDPLLGLAPHLTVGQLDTKFLAPGAPRWLRWGRRLALRVTPRHTKALSLPSLARLVHLYPTAIPQSSDTGTTRLAFFNPATLHHKAIAHLATEAGGGSSSSPRPRWLFVLSAADLFVQRTLLGLREFIEVLLGLLRHTVQSERHATLIAPPLIASMLSNVVPGPVEVLPFRGLAEIERRLLSAEYVFSWNPFSYVPFMRLANELPVFLFDRGIFARLAAPYYEIARATHWGGHEPKYLDQRQLFSTYVLTHLAQLQKPTARLLSERWQASPTPDALVGGLAS